MTPQEAQQIADRIVSSLFANGFGEHAHRLEMRSHGERNLGGWGKPAVRDAVLRALLTTTEPPR